MTGEPDSDNHQRQRRPGIQAVAEATGLSIATVSQALNDRGRIPEATRRRVREAADRLGYQANVHARRLVTGRNLTLAIQVAGSESGTLLPDSAYFVDVLNAASTTAAAHGYALLLAPGAGPAGQLEHLVDGAVVVDPTGAERLLGLAGAGKPVVTAGRPPGEAPDGPWVDNDHAAGTRTVLDHLAEAGCRRPALLTSRGRQSYLRDAEDAYRAWCADRGLRAHVSRVGDGPTDVGADTDAARALLSGTDRPDGVFATLDTIAVGVVRAARDLDLDVPGDLRVAALTDSELLRSAAPPITALDLNPREIGRRAVELVIALAEGREATEAPTVPSRLVARASTAGGRSSRPRA